MIENMFYLNRGCFATVASGFKVSGRDPTTDKHYTIPVSFVLYFMPYILSMIYNIKQVSF